LPGGFEAAHSSHSDVHQYQIRMRLPRQADRIGGIRCLADYFDICFRCQQGPNALSEQRVIVREEYANL
jgi:hypothetical protein